MWHLAIEADGDVEWLADPGQSFKKSVEDRSAQRAQSLGGVDKLSDSAQAVVDREVRI